MPLLKELAASIAHQRAFKHGAPNGAVAQGGVMNQRPSLSCSCGGRLAPDSSQQGIALVITLIMLSVITFMAITLLVMARGHKTTVSTQTDQQVARLANDIAIERAQAELLAPMLSSSNVSSFSMLVSTNFINPFGFVANNIYPTNVNYDYKANGSRAFTTLDWEQNIANLLFSPRPPVFVPTNRLGGIDFRYYLDLNRNGNFDVTGLQFLTNNLGKQILNGTNGNPAIAFLTGDPQWIGVLQYPDRPHSADNPFLSRYCYAVVPISQTLDVNYIHNQAANPTKRALDPFGGDYFRNQGVGTWEINLGAFLYDLNTNLYAWGGLYQYTPIFDGSGRSFSAQIRGNAFVNAASILRYRYAGTPLTLAPVSPPPLGLYANWRSFTSDFIDGYSAGPLMTTSWRPLADPDANNRTTQPWSGSDNTNHYFSVQDLFDPTKTSADFVNRLQSAIAQTNTYDRNTYYRLLSQLGTDSAPESGKININFLNVDANGAVVPNLATNFLEWTNATLFFNSVATRLLANAGYTVGSGPTNLLRITSGVPKFQIQVWPVNYYTPSIHRLLQLAANIYDATSSNRFPVTSAPNPHCPSVFRPILRLAPNGAVVIQEYREVLGTSMANSFTGPTNVDLDFVTNAVTGFQALGTQAGPPGSNERLEPMVAGIPLIIGAKKGLPNFNEFGMQTSIYLSRLLEFRRAVTDGPVTETNQMYVAGITNVYGLEAWNSFSNAYPRRLQLLVTANMRAFVTNEYGRVIVNASVAAATNIASINGWQGWLNKDATRQSFVLPFGQASLSIFLTNSTLNNNIDPKSASASWFDPQTHIFARKTPFYVPHWYLNLNSRLLFVLVDLDANRIVDYVNVNNWEKTLDISAKLAEGAACSGNPSFYVNPAEQWCTNRLHNSTDPRAPTLGIINQIGVGLGLSGAVLPDAGSFSQDPYAGLDGESAIDGFRKNLIDGIAIFPKDQGKVFYKSNLFYAPFDPYRPVTVHTSWQANDPLVHYTVGDLIDLSVQETNRVNFTLNNPPLPNIGQINTRYQPWGGNPFANDPTMDVQIAAKDPFIARPDDWDFPTNKLPNIGWLGRVHRGTPWQTVFLKSTNILQRTLDLKQNFGAWQKWTGNPVQVLNSGQISSTIVTNGGIIPDAFFSVPTNDWHVLDLFTTSFNDNAARGQLSVNQSGLAAWSAVLSGVSVLTDARTNAFIEPAGVYDPLNPPALVRIVNGINNTRTNFPNNAFQRLGDVLATPELTVASPYLSTNRNAILTDEVVERIPQQVLGLLRGADQPRFLIYSYGQTLKPAPHSIVTSGTYFGLCTNYQITAEVATRAVVRIEGAPTNTHAVVESYNVLPPD